MQCPKCGAEVPAWHFYCSSCNALVSEARARAEKSSGGVVERTGQRLVKLLLTIFIGGLIVLMARAVQWRDLAKLVSGESARAAANTSKPPTKKDAKNENSGGVSPEKSALAKSGVPAAPAEKSNRAAQTQASQEKSPDSALQASSGVIEQRSLNIRQVAARPVTVLPSVPSELVALQSTRTPKIIFPLGSAANPTVRSTSIAKGQKQGVRTGSLEITSNTPARVYVDGQFSGWTPRTITLTAGNHKIRLMAEGYEDWARNLSLKTLEQLSLTAAMEKKPDSLLGH
jgi:hypothetical protein